MTMHRNGLLFLCLGTVASSQMAESFARFIGPSEMRYFSACVRPGGLNPYAVRVMSEVGVDISRELVKPLSDIPLDLVSTAVTLCAEDDCPALPNGIHHLSWPLDEPVVIPGDDEENMQAFRRVRDQIRELVSRLF